jgi:hypothetical protein
LLASRASHHCRTVALGASLENRLGLRPDRAHPRDGLPRAIRDRCGPGLSRPRETYERRVRAGNEHPAWGKMFPRWYSTVCGERYGSVATSRLVLPDATSAATTCSRGVRAKSPWPCRRLARSPGPGTVPTWRRRTASPPPSRPRGRGETRLRHRTGARESVPGGCRRRHSSTEVTSDDLSRFHDRARPTPGLRHRADPCESAPWL